MKALIRKAISKHLPGKFRIYTKEPSREVMEKKLFIEIINTLREIEDRSEFMASEIGMDPTAYEDKYFLVIDNLLKLHFTREQVGLIQYYVYQLPGLEGFEGTIELTKGKEVIEIEFSTPEHLWNAIHKV